MTPHILVLVSVNRLWSFSSGEREPNPRNHQNVPIMKKKTQTPCYIPNGLLKPKKFGLSVLPKILHYSYSRPDQIFRPFTYIVLAVFVSRDLFSFEWELLTMCRRLEVTKANKNIWECKSLKFYAVQIPPWIKVPLVVVLLFLLNLSFLRFHPKDLGVKLK